MFTLIPNIWGQCFAFMGTVIIGLVKELYDKYYKHSTFSTKDWLATILGGIVPQIVFYINTFIY